MPTMVETTSEKMLFSSDAISLLVIVMTLLLVYKLGENRVASYVLKTKLLNRVKFIVRILTSKNCLTTMAREYF